MNECVKQGRRFIHALNPGLWDKNISKGTKMTIYKIMTQSVALDRLEILQLPEYKKKVDSNGDE